MNPEDVRKLYAWLMAFRTESPHHATMVALVEKWLLKAAAATEMDDWYCDECDDYFPVDDEDNHSD